MSQQSLAALVPGESLTLAVDTADAQSLASVPVTLILDHTSGVRVVLSHLNGGSDAVPSGPDLLFAKSPAWTAANMLDGVWTVRLLTGSPSLTQAHVGLTTLLVERPFPGPLPTLPAGASPPPPPAVTPTAALFGTVFRVRRVVAGSLGNASSSPPPPPVAYPGPAPTPSTANFYLRINAAGTGFTAVAAATATTPPTVAGVAASGGDYAAASVAAALSPLLPFDPVGSSAARQPLDADLTAIAALTTAGFGRGLLTLNDAAAGRTSLGLGSLAVVTPTGAASSATYLRGDNTWATVAAGVTASTALSDAANLARLNAANAFTAAGAQSFGGPLSLQLPASDGNPYQAGSLTATFPTPTTAVRTGQLTLAANYAGTSQVGLTVTANADGVARVQVGGLLIDPYSTVGVRLTASQYPSQFAFSGTVRTDGGFQTSTTNDTVTLIKGSHGGGLYRSSYDFDQAFLTITDSAPGQNTSGNMWRVAAMSGTDYTYRDVAYFESVAANFRVPVQPPAYAVASLPAATLAPGGVARVSDRSPASRPCYSDGTAWRWLSDNSVVS